MVVPMENQGTVQGMEEGFLGQVRLKVSLKAKYNFVEYRYTKNILAA